MDSLSKSFLLKCNTKDINNLEKIYIYVVYIFINKKKSGHFLLFILIDIHLGLEGKFHPFRKKVEFLASGF